MAENNRFGVIFFLIIIYLLTPYSTPTTHGDETEQFVRNAKRQLFELQNSTYGVPGNLTGLEDVGVPDENGVVRLMPPEKVRRTVAEMVRDVLAGSGNAVIGQAHTDAQDLAGKLGSTTLPTRSKGEGTNGVIEPKPSPDGAFEQHLRRRDISLLDITEPIYHNATGGMYGEWQRAYDLVPYQLSNSTHIEKNVTGNHGRLTIRLEESKPGQVQEVEARISIENEDQYSTHDFSMYGAHLVGSGEMVLTTTSKDFSGIYALPHFARTPEAFEEIRKLWNESLTEAIHHQEDAPEFNPLLGHRPEFGSNHHQCEYIAYLQLHPIHSPPQVPIPYPPYDPRFWIHYLWDPEPITPEVLHEIEQELRHPTGAPLPTPPPIILSSVIYSPNCGYVLQSNEAKGLKREMYHDKVRKFALSAAFIVGIQTWLLIRQMNESSTPSTVSRVSFWSIAMMAIVDGYTACAFIMVSALVESSYLALLTAAFLSLVLVVIFGMRFLMLIWGIQRPERRAAEIQAAQAAAAAAPAATQPAPPGTPLELPAPATAQTPLINAEANNNGDSPRDMSTVYYRFYFALVGGGFLFLLVSSWPPPARHLFVNTFAFVACSFWVPQVYRNIMRGCRKAFSWEYILGTSATRVIPVLYITCWGDNIFYYDGNWKVGGGVVVWLGIQMGILWLQEYAGPRFFIPGNILPPAYDYHPILPIDDLEAAQPFSSTSSTTTTHPSTNTTSHTHTHTRTGLRRFDCAICMHPVDVLTSSPPTGAASSSHNPLTSSLGVSGGGAAAGFGGLTTRRSYMVTPCRHVFHAPCLEGWMRFRLQCPICRNQLPPL